jgi:Protein of unknown function (DUF2934)
MYLEAIRTLHGKMWQWLKDQIAQDVPEADALCEYDCRKQQCSEEEWATCERRIHKAAGELWPESSPPPRGQASINTDDIIDVELHDEIKCRAYELYEQRDTVDGHDPKDRLQAELPRVLYAAAELEKYAKGEVGVIRSARAAQVYLRALSSFIGERDGD